jgi:hypothetical protein
METHTIRTVGRPASITVLSAAPVGFTSSMTAFPVPYFGTSVTVIEEGLGAPMTVK